jgi:hypothetical protein
LEQNKATIATTKSGFTIILQCLGNQPETHSNPDTPEKEVIEAQLAHKGQITHGGVYDRTTHIEDRRSMLPVWADPLDKLARGAEVIQIRATS